MKDAGTKIRELRLKHKLSLQELGDKINFNYSNLSKIERGERKPTLELLENLAEFFNVNLVEFFGESQPVPPELKERDVHWIALGKEMEGKDLSPDDIREIVEFIDKMNKKS
jgi:transcriptional regulator with XRE-family HTH domain